MDTALEKAGIPSERSQRFEKSWEAATDEFLSSPAGANWVGGQQNFERIGEIIQSMTDENGRPLIDQPSAETIAAAWRHMQEKGLVARNPELDAENRIANATSASEIQDALDAYRPEGGGYFRR